MRFTLQGTHTLLHTLLAQAIHTTLTYRPSAWTQSLTQTLFFPEHSSLLIVVYKEKE